MRKNNFSIFLLLVFLVTSCIAKDEIRTNTVQNNKEVKEVQDFSHLKIQTEFTEEDKKYYQDVHNKISEIGKSFAYMEPDAAEKYCSVLKQMFDEISQRPVSIYRERERERERELIQVGECLELYKSEEFENFNKYFSKGELRYLSLKIPDSGYLNLNLEEALSIDPSDLIVYRDYLRFNKLEVNKELDLEIQRERHSEVEKEYCQKAVKLRQWDHIYYITMNKPYLMWDIKSLIQCLEGDESCKCSKAVKLVVGHWPKSYLISGELANPYAEEITESYYEEHYRKLKKLIKELYGRDLDKE